MKVESATLVKYVDPETQEVLYINNIPVSLKDSHELSNVAIIYNQDGKLVQYTELYLTKNAQGNFKVTSYIDNKKVVDKDTDEKFMTASAYKDQFNGPHLNFSVSKLAKCLGISMGLADVIGIGCAAACWLTAGAGCIACVAGLAGFAVGGDAVCIANAFGS
ncbi:hypothetical protein [Virgibacillus senegalensis]|uniref:hypothetical protein n=1 Tax=Virgibacillus senegalensis TaxID=1499679 RepID=UPI00069DC8B2|nr:hypothetical protein [Virgibacillus senegalensis]